MPVLENQVNDYTKRRNTAEQDNDRRRERDFLTRQIGLGNIEVNENSVEDLTLSLHSTKHSSDDISRDNDVSETIFKMDSLESESGNRTDDGKPEEFSRDSKGYKSEGGKFEGRQSEGRKFEGRQSEGRHSEGRYSEGRKFEGRQFETSNSDELNSDNEGGKSNAKGCVTDIIVTVSEVPSTSSKTDDTPSENVSESKNGKKKKRKRSMIKKKKKTTNVVEVPIVTVRESTPTETTQDSISELKTANSSTDRSSLDSNLSDLELRDVQP